jgi:ribosomal protection tetracycline resistance protein
MKQIIAGILAHVDAGKTTLSEALLYSSGSIKKIGRVDNGDAFLDTDAMEKKRGITIFSKQAELQFGDTKMTLLDTPGHVDFSAEMERTLMVLDYAVLVISASDGVQAHTQTLWRLLKRYEIPVFLFINKMDQPGTERETILLELKKQLSDGCIDFTKLGAGTEEAQENEKSSTIMEEIAMEDETAMESFLETGRIAGEQIREMIVQRKIFPCFFGSALRNAGVDTFLQGFDRYTLAPEYPDGFGMKVFKIARDEAGNRLTYLKVTGGTLKVKALLSNADHVRFGEEVWEQKVNQIRIYSGTKYELINEADAGMVCAVTGLDHTYPGQGFGIEAQGETPVLEPVLHFRLILPEGVEPAVMLPKLRQIEEEEPELHIVWNEKLQEIQIQIMGEVQTEILKSMIAERFGVEVSFGPGKIVYKETRCSGRRGTF